MLYPNFKKKRKLRISQSREVLDNLEKLVPSSKQVLEGAKPYAGCILVTVYSAVFLIIVGFIMLFIWATYRDLSNNTGSFSASIATLIIILAIFVPIDAYILNQIRITRLIISYSTNVMNTHDKLLADGQILEGTVLSLTGDKKQRHIEYVFTSPTDQKIHWKYTTRKRVYLKEAERISVLYLDDDTYSLI